MHKFFAKTSFLGKNLISLPECHSTNDFLIAMAKSESVTNGTIVQTESQIQGRGQAGNKWEDSPGQNLIFSLYLSDLPIPISQQYLLNLMTSIAVVETLDNYLGVGDKLEVKWPNDVYLNDMKLAGILIESSVIGRSMEWMVVGVGINIGQRSFKHPKATSLKLAGIDVDKWELLEEYCLRLESYLESDLSSISGLLSRYYQRLRWYEEDHQYKSPGHGLFSGRIVGIDSVGRLKIDTEKGIQTFDIKEVQFIN